ncbi:MAG TPA: YeeE/YedE thiosulfate transporter family protein [Gemmatimonadales bacterium]|nr:YeeE/YedE thiosulfate transporter family protein [Gemmatimonadales bacterium]
MPIERGADGHGHPYRWGVVLGLVLLASFVVAGRGLGVSGALGALVGAGPERDHTMNLLDSWIVVEVIGLVLGALLSAALAGRIRWTVSRGPRIDNAARLGLAFGGGALVGFASRLARGCTSGQGLTGGALQSIGGWLFLVTLFAAAYATARVVRKEWT